MSPMAASVTELVDVDDPKQLREVFGTFPTGVTVVTVGGEVPRGMTASSFTSVSLDPALVLVCVAKDALMHRRIEQSPTLSVSVLGTDQEDVARHFASRSRPVGADQFDAVPWIPGRLSDAPLIDGAAAHIECEKWQAYDGGDHTVFLGLVRAAVQHPREALLFHRGRFRGIVQERVGGRAA